MAFSSNCTLLGGLRGRGISGKATNYLKSLFILWRKADFCTNLMQNGPAIRPLNETRPRSDFGQLPLMAWMSCLLRKRRSGSTCGEGLPSQRSSRSFWQSLNSSMSLMSFTPGFPARYMEVPRTASIRYFPKAKEWSSKWTSDSPNRLASIRSLFSKALSRPASRGGVRSICRWKAWFRGPQAMHGNLSPLRNQRR